MKSFFRKGALWLLIFACILAGTIGIVSVVGTYTPFWERAAGSVAKPFRGIVTHIENSLEELRRHYADYTALVEENEALRKEIAEMRQAVRQSKADSAENVRLRKLLALREQRRDFSFESAVILGRSDNNWTSSLSLNCGTEQGVAAGNCVITEDGSLVGVVSDAGKDWCTVLTVVDTDTEIGAKVFRSDTLSVAKGDFTLMGQGQLALRYLDEANLPIVGDYIVTSGLEGFYPSGLVIGTVASVQTEDSGSAPYAVLNPMMDPDKLTQVFVIKSFSVVE